MFDRTLAGGDRRALEPADHSRRPFRGGDPLQHFRRNLGIATNILKTRLDGFTEAGIMRRHRYTERPELYEYLLNRQGVRALAPTLVALSEWGDRCHSSTRMRCAAPESPSGRCAHTAVAWTTRPRSRPRSGPACPPNAYHGRLDLR
ncbi:winged helix-turn-helix transcriptional regulator [Nonomuraea dietziae]|uniref:winged helix-turn-helix transcriptional regulator n=1 Tax=Nonomuraea dietziae TaxID=65515 RepID=UPI0033FDAF4F